MAKIFPGAWLLAASLSLAAPHHVLQALATPPVIDGILQEKSWQGLDTLRLLRNSHPAGGKPSVETKVLAGWSPTHLYVAFIAGGKDVKGKVTEHDGPLYEEDVVEIFLDPDGDAKDYLELEWNCLNTSLDYSFASPLQGKNIGWTPEGLQHAVKVQGTANDPTDTDTGMTVEIALPWSALAPFTKTGLTPKPGESLKANFYRLVYPPSGAPELIAWAPTDSANFHLPERFGTLGFAPVSSALLPPGRQPLPLPGKAPRPGLRRADGKWRRLSPHAGAAFPASADPRER